MLNIYCVIDVFTKYSWVKPLIEKVNESNCKPDILWVHQGR